MKLNRFAAKQGSALWSPGTGLAAIINIAEGSEEGDYEWTRPTTVSKIPTWDNPTVTDKLRNLNSQVT